MKLLDLPQGMKERRLFGFFDDFLWYLSPHLWTSFNTGAGGASVAAGAAAFGGTAVLTTGATLNNEAAIATTQSSFSPSDDRPMLSVYPQTGLVQVFEIDPTDVVNNSTGAAGADGLADNIFNFAQQGKSAGR